MKRFFLAVVMFFIGMILGHRLSYFSDVVWTKTVAFRVGDFKFYQDNDLDKRFFIDNYWKTYGESLSGEKFVLLSALFSEKNKGLKFKTSVYYPVRNSLKTIVSAYLKDEFAIEKASKNEYGTFIVFDEIKK